MVTFLIIYTLIAVVFYGHFFAYWQHKYPILSEEFYWSDMRFSIKTACIFPVSLITYILSDGIEVFKHGVKFW